MKYTIYLIFSLLLPFQISAQCWNLVWADEFDGTSLNTANWSYQTGGSGWGNNELQYYTNRPENVSVSAGTLKIKALEENYMGSNYTSARINTSNKAFFAYGKMEGRMKLPTGQGIWPAFWMMPDENYYGGWPNSGELDIMELIGNLPARTYGTIHAGNLGAHVYSGGNYTLPNGTFADDFHTFTMEWEPGVVRHYVDDILYLTQTNTQLGANPWPFDRAFHFLLNVAVGGNWPGSPNATTVFPQTMEVDWVRVYQKLNDIVVSGPELVEPASMGKIYSVAEIPGCTYAWTVPPGASIANGQGTKSISVNWGSTSGNVSVVLNNGCGSSTRTLPVTVSTNIWNNPDFEQDLVQWAFRTGGAATGTVSITTSNPQQGIKAALVNISTAGTNPWDAQLSRLANNMIPGQQYRLSFWAKADASRLFSVAFIHPTNYSGYASANFTANTTWQEFTLNFTAPAGQTQLLFNADLGRWSGASYTFDNFSLVRTISLPVEYLAPLSAKKEGNTVRLQWTTAVERENHQFDIERSGSDALSFEKIGSLAADNRQNAVKEYQYWDKNPLDGINYYRIRQIDQDATESLSNMVSVHYEPLHIQVLPSLITDVFSVQSTRSDWQWEKILVKNNLGQTKKVFNIGDQLTLASVEKGWYFLEVFTQKHGLPAVIKIVKQ